MAVFGIHNKRDLRQAYEMVRFIDKLYAEYGVGAGIDKEYYQQLKRDIRSYTNKDERWKDNGYFRYFARYAYSYGDSDDGYVELIMFPCDYFCDAIEEAEKFFEEWFYIHPYYTMYDCTGKPFTAWYHVFKRGEKWCAYHKVSYDV